MNALRITILGLVACMAFCVPAQAQNQTSASILTGNQMRELIINHKGQDLLKDTDSDGISDALELQFSTDPMATDTDGDLVPDGIEVAHGLDPTKVNPYPEFVYLVTKLPIPTNYSDAEAYDISNTGIVSGAAYWHATTSKDSAVRWNMATGSMDTALSDADSYGWAINDNGAIVGKYKGVALYWRSGDSPRTVGLSDSHTNYSSDINPSGIIVGYLNSQFPGETGAYAWSDNGAGAADFTQLPAPSGYSFPRAEAINDKGSIVGLAFSSTTGKSAGVIWNGTTPALMMASLDSAEPALDQSRDINRVGAVLGIKDFKPAVWTPTEGRRFLPMGASSSISAWKMNALGEIVGMLNSEPTLWRPDGTGGWETTLINPEILDDEVALSFWPNSINDAGQIVGSYYDGGDNKLHPVVLTPILRPQLAVDANRDGQIKLASEDASDLIIADRPYRFWPNDDIDGQDENKFTLDSNDAEVNGEIDLREDFFPVFLDLKSILSGTEPGSGLIYKLRHEEGALNMVYTELTRETAFDFRDGDQADPVAHPGVLFQATTVHVTSQGIEVPDWFLSRIRDEGQGVILLEARASTTAPLILTIERSGTVIAEAKLPLSIGQDILLLLHGMNSNVYAWDALVDTSFHAQATTIADSAILGPAPRRNGDGLRCYRVQFGSYDMASTRVGLEGITAANVPGYNSFGTRCGDFQTFEELGQEVDVAITLLMARHPNARVILLGHSRGGLSARAYLESPNPLPTKAVVMGLVTTSSPHLGSRLGRVYGWLNTHPRGHPDTDDDDWDVVDFLLSPYGQPTALDVRRPVILDVADNSLALSTLNSVSALQYIPAHVRCAEIQYAKARFGLLIQDPIKYSVLESMGLGGPLAPQLSSEAIEFLLNGGDPGGVDFIGDGLIPRARQRFTQLAGFSGIALPSRVITDREVVHIEATKQVDDMIAQLKMVAPDMFR